MRGDVFSVFDGCGDLRPLGLGGHGLCYNDSRHLSKSVLRLGNAFLLLLSSTVTQDNARFTVDLTNPHLDLPDGRSLPHRAVHFQRTKSLQGNACHEEIQVRNYNLIQVWFDLGLELESDHADASRIPGI